MCISGILIGGSSKLFRVSICIVPMLAFVACGDFPFNASLIGGKNQDPVKELNGCYRVRIRRIACFDGCNKWWEIKNVCYDNNGNWIESNGLNFKHGTVSSDGMGVLSIDTANILYKIDAVGVSSFAFNGYSHYKIDTVKNIFSFDLDGSNFKIYGGTPISLGCWEFIYPDSMMYLWSRLSIAKPLMCQKTFNQIVDSANFFDKTN